MSARLEKLKGSFDLCIRDNPVVIRDLRTRMRGLGAYGLLVGYLALIAIIMAIVYYTEVGMRSTASVNAVSRVGASMFTALAWTQTIILMLIIPGITSPSVSREYEKKTIEMVVLTKLNSFLFTLGKIASSFFYCLMLVITSLPLAGICLMFGGISPEEIAVTYLITVVYCFMLCTIGVYLSAVIGKTMGAGLAFYGFEWLYLSSFGIGGFSIFMAGYGMGSYKPWSTLMLPSWGASASMDSTVICGVSIPLAILAIVMQLLIGVVLLYASVAKIRHWRFEKAGVLRVLLLCLTVVYSILIMGGIPAGSYGPTPSSMLVPLGVLGFLPLLAVVIGTGPFRKPLNKSMFSYLFSLKSMLKPDLGGALSYMTVTTLLCYFAGAWAFKINSAGAIPLVSYWPSILEQGIMVLSIIWLAVSSGIFFSALFRSRIIAAIMSLVVLVVLCIVFITAGPDELAGSIFRGPFSYSRPKSLHWPDHQLILSIIGVCTIISVPMLAYTGALQKKLGGVVE